MKFVRVSLIAMLLACIPAWSQQAGKRKLIIDQDAAGPAGTDQQSILLLIQSPQTEVLGVTVVTGDAWLKEEVAHTLRMLEIIGRTDIPVVPGAEYPLVRRKAETELWEQQYGSVPWVGAWTPRRYHAADQLGDMPEGKPTTKALDESQSKVAARSDSRDMLFLAWAAGATLLRLHKHPSALNTVLLFQHHPDRFGVHDVLLLQNASRQRVFVIAVEHGHYFLHQDGAVVEVGVHEVDSAARNLHAIVESLLLRLQSRKRRQQRRMNIEDAVGKLLHKPRRQQTHVSRKANQIDLLLA